MSIELALLKMTLLVEKLELIWEWIETWELKVEQLLFKLERMDKFNKTEKIIMAKQR
jgi:hypothetical protein